MSFVSPGTEYDFVLGIASIFMLLIFCGLVFGILASLLINNNRKKGSFLIVWIAIGILGSLIVTFKNYTALGIASSVIYIIFIVLTFFVIKHKKKMNNNFK